MKLRWRQFVRVSEWEKVGEGVPYYVQWSIWCWRRPIWVGLPLVWLAVPLLVIDVVYIIVFGLIFWAKRR